MAVYSEYEINNIVRNPQFKQLMLDIFDISSGHDHDGVNTKAVSVGTVADSAITNAKVNAAAAIDATKLGNGDVSNTELSYLNGVTSAIQTQIDAISTAQVPEGTPVNAVASQGTLTVSGVAIDGETITIGSDVYEFCADTAQSLTAGSDFAIDITGSTTASQGTFTVTVQPSSAETFTVGDKVFTFVPNGTANADGEVSVGADLAAAQVNIVAAINGTDGFNTASAYVTAGAFATNASVLTALIGGVAGDSIATTETMANGSFDAVTLGTTTGGADCSAANAVTAAVTSITNNDTAGVGAADGAGDTVVLTADTKGTAGDAIATTETMSNGAFGQATLGDTTAGVDGTVGSNNDLKADGSYLYIAIADNTIADANWRRISVGSVY